MTSRILTLHDPTSAKAYYAAGHWRSDTLYSLLCDRAAERPDALAIRDGGRQLSWREVLARVDALAADLAGNGVIAGDRVGLWLPNRVEAVIAFIACARQGLVAVPSLHVNYTGEEIRTLLGRIRAAAVIAEAGWGAKTADGPDGSATLDALSAADHMKAVYRLEPGRKDPAGFPVAPPAGDGAPRADDPDRVVYLAFTSGTTGQPKGVMHSTNSLLANARDLVADWGHGPETVLLSLSPLSHHIAWVGVGQWLLTGCVFATDDAPKGTSRLDWIVETGATYVMGVPTHAMDILAEQRRRGQAGLGRVSVFYMAGAPIPRATAEAFVEQGITPQNVYGMTENSSHQYTHPTDATDTIVGTCGRGGGAYEVTIVAEDDPNRYLPAGQAGQIAGRGAALMLGYFDNQLATETSFNRDGWFLSGDLGRLDDKGCLQIVGRLKDVIIRGGHNIHPARIEELAVRHPDIGKAAAFAVADERLGERVCLAILAASATPPDATTVLNHLYEQGLSKVDMPEYFLVLDEFPLTASGKILKRELADWSKSGRISPEAVRFREPETS